MDLREVERLQRDLLALVDQMTAEPDVERQQQLVKRIAEQSLHLSRVCDDLEAEARAESRDRRGSFEVELTPDQRATVRERTGVTMSRLVIEDSSPGFMSAMSQMDRSQVLTMALARAEREKRDEAARRVAAAELARITEELNRDAPEQVRHELARLMQDPEFRKAFEPRGKR